MSRSDADLAAEIAPAGIRFIERDRAEGRLPAEAANIATSCRREDGRIDAEPHEVLDVDDPERALKLDAGWLRLANEHGLLNPEREFLLQVDYADEGDDWPQLAWIRVQLQDDWSIAGGIVPALGGFGVPEFTAMAIHGDALMRTTVWGNGKISSLAIPQPSTARPIRKWAEYMAHDPSYPVDVQAAAQAWLAKH